MIVRTRTGRTGRRSTMSCCVPHEEHGFFDQSSVRKPRGVGVEHQEEEAKQRGEVRPHVGPLLNAKKKDSGVFEKDAESSFSHSWLVG